LTSTDTMGGVTPRVVLLCLVLAVCFGYVIPLIDIKLYNTFLGSTHLPPGALAVLLILLLVINPLLRVLHQRWAFKRSETLTIYISCLFSTLVPGHGSATLVLTQIIGAFYYATRENKWLEFLRPHLKPWLTPALTGPLHSGAFNGAYNRNVIEDWYVGLRPGAAAIPWSAWLLPLLAWGSLIFATYLMLGCLGVMLRAQWAEHEALSFPLLRLPLQLTEDMERMPGRFSSFRLHPSSFFRNPLMWMGFALAVFIELMNGLNQYFPAVPPVPLEIPTGPLFTEAPWNQIGMLSIVVNPIAVGISYLLASEVGFSLWFFFWFFKLQLITAYYLGFPPAMLPAAIGVTGGTKVFAIYQVIGAYLVYAGLLLWTARAHLGHVVARAFHFYTHRAPPGAQEKSEALSYPAAFWGFVLSLLFMIVWSLAAGMSWYVALWLWTAYLVMALGLTRLVAEGGILFASQGWTPLGPVAQILGSGPGTWLLPASIVPAAFVQAALCTDNRCLLLPGFIHAFKLARDHQINAKALWKLITTCLLISLVTTMWMRVRLGYTSGGLQLHNKWVTEGGAQLPVTTLMTLAQGINDFTWLNALWLGLGGILTCGLMLARSRFLWFPLHPLGLLMSLSYPMSRLWFSILLGWGCKTLIMRFGGSDTYRKMMPAFLGMVVGEVVMIVFWLVIDGWQGRTEHLLMAG